MAERFGVVKLLPDPSEVPPVDTSNQLMVAPEDGVAVSVIVPGPQRDPGTTDATEGDGTIVANTAVRADVHPLSRTST